jgi:hypothetical protein
MTEQEQKALARTLSEGSKFVDFDSALQLVQYEPARAEELVREREESERKQEELSRAFRRLQAAARELR